MRIKALTSLKVYARLDLSDNYLTDIGCFYFYGLNEMIYLDLNNNRIKSLCADGSVFSQNELLESIDLSNNNLEKCGIFEGLFELKYLYF